MRNLLLLCVFALLIFCPSANAGSPDAGSTGHVTAQYILNDLKRPSGLDWDGQSLWIAEFDGKIWRLPV